MKTEKETTCSYVTFEYCVFSWPSGWTLYTGVSLCQAKTLFGVCSHQSTILWPGLKALTLTNTRPLGTTFIHLYF